MPEMDDIQPRSSYKRPKASGPEKPKARKRKPTRLLDSRVSDTIERRAASRRWMSDNYWPAFREVFQLYKNKVPKIIGKDGKEDLTRTNVCMPDAWIIGRRKSARMSTRPPNFSIRSKNPSLSDWFAAWLRFQWDRGGEQRIQRRHILQAQLFGLSVKGHFWDQLVSTRRYRYATDILMKERGLIQDETGELRVASADESEAGLSHPIESYSPEDRAQVLLDSGDELTESKQLVKWEGPVSKFIFIGDLYMEPEAETIHSAGWVIVDDFRDVEWLAYFSKKKFMNPESGEEEPVFDIKAVEDLIDMGTWDRIRAQEDEFKQQLRDALFQTRPQFSSKLIPGKKFLITEEHTFRDGWPWLRWIGNERILLGEMPYPWDLYGHYAFSTLTPIPDLLYAIGDSPLIMGRALFKLHNTAVSQRTDELVNRMKLIIKKRQGADIPSEVADRSGFRVIELKNFNDYQFEQTPSVPAESWEFEKQIVQMIQLLEPAMTDFGSSSQAVPDAQKVATLGLLQKASLDSLSSDEMSQLDASLSEEAEIKLYMLQQSMRDKLEISTDFFSHAASLKAGDTNASGPRIVTLGPLEIQEDFQVFPESYSTLALDDEDKRRAANEIYATASQNPRVWNLRKAAELKASTYRGHTADELLNDPAKMPPPIPPFKLTVNWKDLTPELQTALLQRMGIQPGAGQQLAEQVEHLESLQRGGDVLHDLSQPADIMLEEEMAEKE